MLTLNQIIEQVKAGKTHDRQGNALLDGRDYSRLCSFFPVEQWKIFGFKLLDGKEPPEILEFTKDKVLELMTDDLDFAFSKAINHRGISSLLMFEVMKMWMWVLEDGLKDFSDYEPYGLPLYKEIAKKYNLPDESSRYCDEY